MKSVALHNLGCKVNGYEMDVMQQMLQEKGYKIVSFDQIADIYIINTCTVTNIADRKSRQMLHRAKKQNPDAIVVAVGCYVQTGEEAIRKDPAIDLAIGNNRKKDVLSIVEDYLREKEEEKTKECRYDIIDINHTNEYEEMTLTKTAEHTRAYIKIQDGCNQFCSYCIIPFARGRVRSRQETDILKEVQGIVDAGYQEIVLTGIHLSSYGIDRGGAELLQLLEKLNEIDGLNRIRLGSLEPRIITEEFAGKISSLKKVCPHFHLSLQSGSDSVLKRMNRRYDSGEYYEKTQLLRSVYDNPAITTDVIVGFPGETEEEFEETKRFVQKVNFFEMHIFKYSIRQGTVAANMEGQLTDAEKTKRSEVLMEMEKQMSHAYRQSYIGKEMDVLWEEQKEVDGKTVWIGHTPQYIKVALENTDGNVSGEVGREVSRGVGQDVVRHNMRNQITRVIPDSFLDDETLLVTGAR